MEFLPILKEIGFEENEIATYISLLKLGSATATQVSKESDIERTLTYKILDKLIDKGLATYSIENKKRYFYPSKPEKILEDLKEKLQHFKDILPSISSLAKVQKETETRVEIYRGKEGLKKLVHEILIIKRNYVTIGGETNFAKLFSYFGKYWMKQLEKHKIKERVILREGVGITLKSKNSQFRFLPKEYPLPAAFGVIENKVGIIILSEPFLAVVIENEELAKTFMSFFELLWKIAKEKT